MEESLKLGLIEQYVENQNILHILPHAWFPYLILTIKYWVWLIILWLLRKVFEDYLSAIQWLVAIIGLIIFVKYMYDFLNRYLDTVVLTDKWVTVVRIDNRFRYKVDFFERKNIISIGHSQSWIIDKLTDQGDLKISLDHDSDYLIEGVSSPGKQSSIVNKYKFDILSRLDEEAENETLQQPDKFEVLVNTLSDVIESFMKNNHPRN